MRDPSIHIKLSALKKLFNELKITADATQFWMRAYELRVTNRTPLLQSKQGNDSTAVKTFSRVLNAVRQQLGHKGITNIERTTKQYPMLVEVAELAANFCAANALEPEEGYKLFCEIGIGLMKSYSINRFKYHLDDIYKHYQAYADFHAMTADEKREVSSIIRWYVEGTKMYQFEKEFRESLKYLGEWVGIFQDAKQCQTRAKDYLYFQLDWFASFADSLPAPSQLHGSDNVLRYLQKNPIQSTVKKVDEAYEEHLRRMAERKLNKG